MKVNQSKKQINMKHLHVNKTFTNVVPKSRILTLLAALLISVISFAHEVTGYSATCLAGPKYQVTASVINVNSASNYAWQYKNSSGTWVCIFNGNNVINGVTYSISGASSTATTTPSPIVFNNPGSGLNGLELRMVISDGAGVNPCNLPAGNTWYNSTGVANPILNVNGTPCATPNTNNCTCPGNLIINPSFESGTSNWTWGNGTLTTGNGAVACGSFSGDLQNTSASSFAEQQFATDLPVGTVINVSVYAGTHDASVRNYVAINFFDANGFFMGSSYSVEVDKVLGNAPVGPQLYTFSITVPAGAKYSRAAFGGTGSYTKTDNWCVTTTAPPCPNAPTVTNASTCAGNSATLTVSGNSGATYKWYATSSSTTVLSTSNTYNPGNLNTTTSYFVTQTTNGCESPRSQATITVNPLPVITECEAYVNGTYSILSNCSVNVYPGNSLTLSVNLTDYNNISSQTWTGPNGYSASGNDALISNSITAVQSGVYTITVTTTSGCVATKSITVNVLSCPNAPTVTNASICAGNSATLTVSGNSAATYKWYATSTSTTVLSTSNTYNPGNLNTTTSYFVTQTIGCESPRAQATITVNPLPVITDCEAAVNGVFGFLPNCSVTLYAGSSLTLSVNPSFPASTQQVWSGPNGFTATGNDAFVSNAVTTTNAGAYTITVTDPNGCSTTKTITVNLLSCPNAPTVTNASTCAGSSATLTVSGNSGATYKWYATATSTTVLSTSNTYNPGNLNTTTSYFVTQTIGCESPRSQATITVNPLPVITDCEAWVDGVFGFLSNCTVTLNTGSSLSLSVNPSFPASTQQVWTGPNGYTATGNDAFVSNAVTTANAGAYTITVTDANGCSTTKTITVIVLQKVNLGNLVWYDRNNNGTNDATDPKLSGVTVNLYRDSNNDGIADGAAVATTITDGSGLYNFSGLTPDTYIVGVVTPAGYGIQTINGGDPDNDTDNDNNGVVVSGTEIRSNPVTLTTGGEPTTDGDGNNGNLTVDFGFKGTGSIGDRLWLDTNGNGIQDAGETNGISNATVQLKNSAGVIIATTTTNASGNYLFTNLSPDNYTVVFPTNVQGAILTLRGVGVDNTIDSDPFPNTGETSNIQLGAGQNILTIDAGYYQPLSLGNLVFIDKNDNGIFEPALGESGYDGAIVKLYADNDDNGIADGAAIATQTTSGGGLYNFTNLAPGKYFVQMESVPSWLFKSNPNGGDPDNNIDNDNNGLTQNTTTAIIKGGTITLSVGGEPGGNANTTYDFGFYKSNGLGDFVFLDANVNGIQDVGEVGIAGVIVQLKNAAGTVLATATTDANGYYYFYDPAQYGTNTYNVVFLTPAGYTASPSNQGTDDTKDSDPVGGVISNVTVPNGTYDHSLDAGFYIANLNLGNFVFYDKNNNGIQDVGEYGLDGATVNLYRDANGDNVPDGASIVTTTTAGGGLYNFGSLLAGNYIVGVVLPSGYIGGNTTATSATPNNDDNTDNNGWTTVSNEFRSNFITLAVGTEPTNDGDGNNGNLSLDFGIRGNGSIGDFVWNDLNGNGIQDAGEPGITGATVTITYPNGSTATTTTDANGGYSFTNLIPGTYSISFTTPTGATASPSNFGSDDAKDSDPVGGVVSGIVVTAGSTNTTVDAGFVYPLGSIGNRVWEDVNKDGIQDATEVGVSGVTVSLFDNTGELIATTVTDGLGNYKFNNLTTSPAGVSYSVGFSLPAQYVFSPLNANAGGLTNDANSDANATTGKTGTITLTNTVPNVTYVDAGIYYAQPNKIGDFIWNDVNGNGIQDAGEPGIAGVTVTLYNSAGVAVATTVTDNNGQYRFTDVPAGTYTLGFTEPVGYTVTLLNQGANTALDNNFIASTRRTAPFTVTSTTVDLGFDGGLIQDASTKASVGDKVWYDVNSNNLQDAGETGVAGITVELYNSAGVLQGTRVTDAFGEYMFNNLNPGSYYIKFSNIPASLTLVTATVGTNRNIDSDVNNANGVGTTSLFSLNADQNRTDIDAGLRNTNIATLGSIGDKVWYDLNKNGLQDAGEAGVPGVTVSLINPTTGVVITTTTTDENGNYLFTDLPNSTSYILGFSNIPGGYDFSAKDQGADDNIDSDVNSDTKRTGVYTINTAVAATKDIRSVDAGIVSVPDTRNGKATIGDKVWNDLNGDGIQNSNEPGVAGVVVTLYSGPGANGIWGDADDVVAGTTTTDGLGNYIFTNLDAGVYQVGFTKPTGFNFSTSGVGTDRNVDSDPNATTGRSSVITLLSGEVNTSVDAGLVAVTPKSNLGDKVWYDANSNGIQDAGETGVPGVSVSLINAVTNTVLATTVTNALGEYLFTGLDNGSYIVAFSNYPSGYTPTGKNAAGSTTANGSDVNVATGKTDAITLGTSVTDLNWDLGLVTTTKASVGDYVWYDANGNGIQDATELPAPGITVTLYNSSNVAVATAVTDSKGGYLFTNLDPGTYTIGFSNTPTGSSFTTKGASGSTAANGSDVNPSTGRTDAFTLTGGQVNRDIDAGLVSNFAAVGNYVWFDDNGDGVQNATESGVPGITVALKDASGNIVASAVTDGNGYYFINNIPVAPAGTTFTLQFTGKPTGANWTARNSVLGDATNTSDVYTTTTILVTEGTTTSFTLLPGQIDLTWDAGMTRPSALPVSLLSFNGALNGVNNAKLTWVATNEINFASYQLERSVDGANYNAITNVTPRGTSSGNETYNYNDNISGLTNKIYYRLKMTDKDGTVKYSNIVIIRLGGIKISNIYPNPFVESVRVELESKVKENAQVRIVDMNGKVVVMQQQAIQIGGNQFTINGLGKLANGTYIIEVTTSNEKMTEKLVKK